VYSGPKSIVDKVLKVRNKLDRKYSTATTRLSTRFITTNTTKSQDFVLLVKINFNTTLELHQTLPIYTLRIVLKGYSLVYSEV